MGSSKQPPGLLDYLITRLAKLPGKRTLTTSVLISQPRKSPASVFPYAPNIHNSEIYLQDICILVAESSSNSPNEPSDEAKKPVYVSGLEAILYIFPVTRSVIIYISKVDSTGQGLRPSPTKTMVLAFLEHATSQWFRTHLPAETLSPNDRRVKCENWNIWIQLFARSQNQYLFPGSIEHSSKHILSDIGLIKWWKSTLDSYTSAILGASKDEAKDGREKPIEKIPIAKFVVVPGLADFEVAHALRIPPKASNVLGDEWHIGHSYSTENIVYPLGVLPCSMSQLIPYFPDDPKARLLDEVANTTSKQSATIPAPQPTIKAVEEVTLTKESSTGIGQEGKEPPTKRRKLEDGEEQVAKRRKLEDGLEEIIHAKEEEAKQREELTHQVEDKPKVEADEVKEDEVKVDYLRTVSTDEFWARMDGRQECRLGAVAFFATYVGSHPSSLPFTPTSQQDTLSSTASVVSSLPTDTTTTPLVTNTLRPKRAEVPVAMLRKVEAVLDNHDFATTEKAIHSTEHLQNIIKSLAASNISINSRIPGVSEEGIEETEELEEEEIVRRYLVSEMVIDNPDLPAKVESTPAPPVTVLAVRKKKKPVPS